MTHPFTPSLYSQWQKVSTPTGLSVNTAPPACPSQRRDHESQRCTSFGRRTTFLNKREALGLKRPQKCHILLTASGRPMVMLTDGPGRKKGASSPQIHPKPTNNTREAVDVKGRSAGRDFLLPHPIDIPECAGEQRWF